MLNILRTFPLGFHRFFSLYSCSAWNRRDRDASTAPTTQNAPNTRESCSRTATVPPAARRLFTQGTANGGTERPRREHCPNCTKTPPTREKAAAARRPCRPPHPARRLFTRGTASGGTEVALAPRSRGGYYHKSPNDATLQLCTPKRELEQFFHPPLLAANYINTNISGVL